jgi:hypothetical protein
MRYTVTAYVNVAEDSAGRPTGMLDGYKPGDKLARVGTVGEFQVEVPARPPSEFPSASSVFEKVFEIGNRMAADLDGNTWPSDVRSMSVGDVIEVRPYRAPLASQPVAIMACDKVGWTAIRPPAPTDIVALAGTNATSRGSE